MKIRRFLGCLLLSLPWFVSTLGQQTEIAGLIIPRDDDGMYLRNPDGQFEISWTDKTKVSLATNTRLFSGLRDNQLTYKIHSSKETLTFKIPSGPITGEIPVRRLDEAIEFADKENWIAEFGLRVFFNQEPKIEQLPTKNDPRFIGSWNPSSNPRTLLINGKRYEVSLKKGGQTTAQLFGILSTADCNPFINRAKVVGRMNGHILVADEIHIYPIGDQAKNDDPQLPRYLFIGDSISGNYDKGLRETLQGHFNIHHPPTNCGPSRKGRDSIVEWLGAYEEKGREWDVISFNHGHWDAGNNKKSYQENLESIIVELKKTGAKLVWVTTCPVPNGFPPAGQLDTKGKAPKRISGVMEKFLNPWAAEVMQGHPKISICDQWQFVKDHEKDIYKDWWPSENVHFRGEKADALGRFLGEHIAKLEGIELE